MEQRRRTRVRSRKEVRITGSGGQATGEVLDISLKGCFVAMRDAGRPRVGEQVQLVIQLEPGDQTLRVATRGKVARETPSGIGIDFQEVRPESFHHLFRLVQYNAPNPESIEEELGSSAFDSNC